MDMKVLRIVESVARLQSFSRAADEVCLSVAAVSAAVGRAERDIGLQLFERSTRSVRLTPLGDYFLPEIRLLLKQYEGLLHAFGETVKHRRGKVTVGCLASIAVRVMPAAIAQCRRLHPGVEVEIRDAQARAVYDDVASAHTDFAIVGAFGGRHELRFEPFFHDPMALICPADSPLARRRRVGVRELAGEDFVLMSRETGVRAVLEERLGPMQERFRVAHQVTQLSSVIGMVEAGLGISLVPGLAVPRFLPPSLAVVPLVPRIDRPIGLLRRLDRPLSPAAEAFFGCVRAAFPDGGPGGIPK